MSLTIDSSVFLSALMERDSFHQKSSLFFQKLSASQEILILPALVICEILHVLNKFHIERGFVEKVYQTFLDANRFQIVPVDTSFAKLLLQAFGPLDLKTSDMVLATTAWYYQTKLVTWDKKMIGVVKHHIDVLKPDQFS